MHTAVNLHLILLLLAVIFAGLAAVNVPSHPRWLWFPASFFVFLLAAIFV